MKSVTGITRAEQQFLDLLEQMYEKARQSVRKILAEEVARIERKCVRTKKPSTAAASLTMTLLLLSAVFSLCALASLVMFVYPFLTELLPSIARNLISNDFPTAMAKMLPIAAPFSRMHLTQGFGVIISGVFAALCIIGLRELPGVIEEN